MNLHENQCWQPKHVIDMVDCLGRSGSCRGKRRKSGGRCEEGAGAEEFTRVGCTAPVLGHAEELRSGKCERGRGQDS